MEADGVRPALDHYWLVIHVSVATMAIGVFAVAAALSLVQLVKDRGERTTPTRHQQRQPAAALTGRPTQTNGPAPSAEHTEPADRGFWGRLADVLPGSGELERYAYRLNAVGFLLWTFTLIAGAIWAEQTWGRPWDWDPKEVGTFVVWVVYAAYLHARATRGWDGRKAAYLGLSGFVLVLINYFVVNLFRSEERRVGQECTYRRAL